MTRYRTAKRDANHAGIVAALRSAGCSVLELHAVGDGCPDLLCGARGRDYLLEVKRPGVAGRARGASQARTNARQAGFRDAWRGHPVAVVTSAAEALTACGIRATSAPR